MSLTAIKIDVQANLPTAYHSSVLTTEKIYEFINKAQREICRRHNFTFMEFEAYVSTTDEQREYALPTAVAVAWEPGATLRKYKSEISCKLIDTNSLRVELTKLFKSNLETLRQFGDTSEIGTPSHYCISGGYIELWPKPDHSLNGDAAWTMYLDYYGYLLDLSSTSQTNEIETNYPLALEYHATAQGFRYGMDMEMAEYYEAKYEEIFKQMTDEDNVERVSKVKDYIRPADGQSLGSEHRVVRTLKAFYE